LVMFGSQDHLVPVATAESFQEQMKQFNNICQLIIFEGAKHGFFNGVKTKVNEDNKGTAEYFYGTLQASDDFLVGLDFLVEKANVRDYFH
jgi:acetyl esterase